MVKGIILILIAAVPLFATEPNPSIKQRELIDELLRVTQMESLERRMVDAMLMQMDEQFLAGMDPSDTAKIEEAKIDMDRFREIIRNSDLHTSMREVFMKVYARRFNEKELADIVAFYKTPTGSKLIQAAPEITAEAMKMSGELLGPVFEAAQKQVAEERTKRNPWKKTMADLRTLATALEARATDMNEYPNTTLEGLKALLEPTYIKQMPMKDAWGNDYAYLASPEGYYYRFVSAGADGIFEWESRRIIHYGDPPKTRYTENPNDDIIYADGMFFQAPKAAEPYQ